MATIQSALTARKDKPNTTVHTSGGAFKGTIIDDGTAGDSIKLRMGYDNGLDPIQNSSTMIIPKAAIACVTPDA